MAEVTATAQVTSALANGGVLTFAYATGRNAASYTGTSGHTLSYQGTVWRSPDITVSFGASTISVTYNGGPEIPDGAVLTLTTYPREPVTSHPGIIPGFYYMAETVNGASTAVTVGANTFYAQPFILRGTFDHIGIEVTTFVAGAARMGLYANGDNGPGALILDAGTLNTGTSNGIKPITITARDAPDGIFWVASVFNAGVGCRAGGAQRTSVVGTAAPTNTVRGLSGSFTYGELPATAPAMTLAPSTVPMMLIWKNA